MKLIRVTIQGFRSFNRLAIWQLDREPGLVLITGKNLVDKQLGANGVGKSTLFYALRWCLWGTTATGERGPSLLSDGTKGPATVTVDAEVDGRAFRVTRQQSPNRLALSIGNEERVVAQADIDQLIRVTDDEFMRGCYHAQGSIGFVGFKPQGMLDEFSSYLNLDRYDRAQQYANQRWQLVDQKRRTAEQALEAANSMLVQFREQEVELEDKAHTRARADLSEARKHWSALIAAKAAVSRLQEQIEALGTGDARKVFEARCEAAGGLVARAEKAKQRADRLAARLDQQWADMKKLLTEIECPTCGQPWDRSETALDKRRELKPRRAEALEEQENAELALENAVIKRDGAETRLRKLVEQGVGDLARVETQLAHTNQEINRIKDQLAAINRRRGDTIVALRWVQRSIRSAKEQQEGAKADLARATEDEAGFGYWRKGFKLLKLEVISTTVAKFQGVGDQYLAELGMPRWHLNIDADSALDGKGKLRVHLDHKSGARRNPTELSFGENQRVKIAVDLAVGDVCLAARGVTSNVELWDEPMTWLSADGIKMFLAMLDRRAHTLNRTIFISDHRTLEWEWTETMMITRNKHGSRLRDASNMLRIPGT